MTRETATTDPAIRAEQVARRYRADRGVCGLDLQVSAGACHALVGPNGSGKSTFLRLVTGLEGPDEGTLHVLGVDLARRRRGHLGRCGVVMDNSPVWPTLTGRQHAYFVARSYGLPRKVAGRRVAHWLDLADLADQADEPVGAYSFGMRRKLSLVQSACHEPELLILDEPTIGVDAAFVARWTQWLRRRRQAGQTTLIAANDLDWIAPLADHITLMHRGRRVAEGTVAGLLADLRQDVRVEADLAEAIDLPADRPAGVVSVSARGTHVEALVAADGEPAALLVPWLAEAGAHIARLEVRRPTLRDVFLHVTGEAMEP